MPKNKLSDLRNHLFDTLERLMDEEDPLDVKRAGAVANVSREILSSAKVELQFLELTGQESKSSFLGDADAKLALPPAGKANRGKG